MNRLTTMIAGLGLGAGLMYFYDPRRGRRRRALVRDQVNSFMNRTDDALEVAVEDLRNRTRGVLAEMMARVSNEGAPSWILEERVRAELGRQVRHARRIEVTAEGDRIVLRGPILAEELNGVLRSAAGVRGVRSVDNQLQVHTDPGDVPSLQGARAGMQLGMEPGMHNWSPSMRLLGGAGGGLLTLWGMARGGLPGTLLKMAGLGLIARGVTNLDFRRLVGTSSDRDTIRIRKAINIRAPIQDVYAFWANFENFPRFMAHLTEVTDMGNGRSHWKAVGPAGAPVEWDAVITRQVPNESIAWESVEGAPVKNQGSVHFSQSSMGGDPAMTTVNVTMSYSPPAGALGHVVATLFRTDPKTAMDEDLARLKGLLEEGKTSVAGQEIRRQDLGSQGRYLSA